MDRADVAVIVPVAPGDDAWQALLPTLMRAGLGECVVVLGDASTRQGLPDGARIVFAPVGRASQLNAGATASACAVLWFLHADSQLDDVAFEALDRHLQSGAPGLGYFDLAFAADGPAAVRLNAWGATFRSRVLGLPFGDQGFVVRRADFLRLGMFPAVPGEDHAFVWRARRARIGLHPLGATITTSARKYAVGGWWRTTCAHAVATLRQGLAYSRMEMPR